MPAQRWRLTYARTAEAPALAPREQTRAWEALVDALDVPATPSDRPRLVHGAPLTIGMTAGRELVDLLLPHRWTIGPLRDRLVDAMPPGHHVVDLYDVWVGEPSLPSIVIAGDYRITVTALAAPGALDAAVRALLASETVDRARAKGGRTVVANLRPLIDDVRVLSPTCLWMRLRFDPILGTGRPDDVLDALAAFAGGPIVVARRHRERLWLRGQGDA